jgi:hypothetical protein
VKRILGSIALAFVVLMVMNMLGLIALALIACGVTLGGVYAVWPFLFRRSSTDRLSPEDLQRVHDLADESSPSSDT